jgi:hypothetical protein
LRELIDPAVILNALRWMTMLRTTKKRHADPQRICSDEIQSGPPPRSQRCRTAQGKSASELRMDKILKKLLTFFFKKVIVDGRF